MIILVAAALLSVAATSFAAQPSTDEANDISPRDIHIDATRTKGPLNRAYRFSVGSDRAIIHLRPEHQRDLRFVKETCGFEYMRFHGLLNEEMHIVKAGADGEISYDWTNVDRVYDLLRELKIRPIVELGFMPEALASGTKTIFWWKGNVTPPKSYEQWADFIEQLARHLTQRYGADEVRKWYFEVWNEPNLDGFWTGGCRRNISSCTRPRRGRSSGSMRRIASAVPRRRGLDGSRRRWPTARSTTCRSTSSRRTRMERWKDFSTKRARDTRRWRPNADSVIDGFPVCQGAMRNSKWPDLPVLVTEWGPSYSPRDPVHDSYFCAAWILHRLRRLPAGVTAMSYWTFSDQFEEAGPPKTPFHGGFGLLNVQGLPKAAYFAYRFLNELGDTELACDDPNVWACRSDGSGAVQVLLWDYHQPKQDAPNAKFFARDWPAKPAGPVRLVIDHLPPGAHTVNLTRVGYRHNDVYTAYLDLGSPTGAKDSPSQLPDDVVANLRTTCSGTPETRQMSVEANRPLSLELPMNENDVYLVTIAP